MSFAFVCAKQDDGDWDSHETIGAMVRCARCERHAVGGYMCDTCGHEDIDEPDNLVGHGVGKCEPAVADTGGES